MGLAETGAYRNWTEVDVGAFRHNLRQIRGLVGAHTRIMQIVKADAYGHGALEIANIALAGGAEMLGVANADEGAQLRIGGVTAPIVILSPSTTAEIPEIIKYSLTPSVSQFAFAQELAHAARRAHRVLPLHVEVDTGMGRGGILHHEGLAAIKKISRLAAVVIEGIFTHLAVGETGDSFNMEQFQQFRALIAALEKKGLNIPLKHIANSGAVINFPDFFLDVIRPGLMSYGVYPADSLRDKVRLKQVMAFKTRIILVKAFPPGSSIGYGRTFITNKETTIATIPVGYADGLPRLLSNRGEVLVRGRRCPVVGRISMDLCTIDVSDVPGCASGDEVVLLGSQGRAFIGADEVARGAQTISYEVLCALGKRAPRVFVNHGKLANVAPRLRRMFIPDEEKSPPRVEGIIRQCLQLRTKSVEVGNAIYSELLEMLLGRGDAPLELREKLRYSIVLEDFRATEIAADASLAGFYKVLLKIEYRKKLHEKRFMVGCARDESQLNALFQERRCEYRWLLEQPQREIAPQDFQLRRVKVGGKEARVTGAKSTTRGWEIWCEAAQENSPKPVQFSLALVTRQPKEARTFSVHLVYPTRGVEVTFDYSRVNVPTPKEVCFFAGRNPYPHVVHQPGKRLAITVSDEEWIFPHSGITFVW